MLVNTPMSEKIQDALISPFSSSYLKNTDTPKLILHLRLITMFSKIFTSRASSVSESNKSQDVFKHHVSSKTKTAAARTCPAKEAKQTKFKGKGLRRKVRAGTKKRVFLVPTAAEVAVMRGMRDRFIKMPQRDLDFFNAPAPEMRWDDDVELRSASADAVAFEVSQFVGPPMEWALPRMIYVDEIDFEAAGMAWR